MELKLLSKLTEGGTPKTLETLEKQFRDDLQSYYFRWLSPIDRKTQLLSNLKLGFGLLFALILFFLFWGLLNLWTERLVKALVFFSLGTTIVELNDFFKSTFFDTIGANRKRKGWSKAHEIFPVPASRGWYLASFVFVITLSVAIAEWPIVSRFVRSLLCWT